MSIRVMAEIMDGMTEDKTELLVLLVLANYADDEGRCYPSIGTVARKSRLSVRGAQGVISRLCEKGWLEVVERGARGGTNLFRITDKPRSPCTPAAPAPPAAGSENPAAGSENPAAPAPYTYITFKNRHITKQIDHTSKADLFSENQRSEKPDRFEDFWQAYPSRPNPAKANARKAFLKALRKTDADTLVAAAKVYASSRRGEDEKYTAMAATWLNQERWTDVKINGSGPVLTGEQRVFVKHNRIILPSMEKHFAASGMGKEDYLRKVVGV